MKKYNLSDLEKLENHVTKTDKSFTTIAENFTSKDSLAGLHESILNIDFFIANERNDLLRKSEQAKRTYSTDLVTDKTKEAMTKFDTLIEGLRLELKTKVKTVIDNKIQDLKNMVIAPPTAEQKNTLEVISLRENLTEFELKALTENMSDNYNALKVLQDVAHSKGYTVTVPSQYDVEIMLQAINNAGGFLLNALNELGKEKNKKDLMYSAFYTQSENSQHNIYDPLYKSWVRTVDTVPQLNEFKAEKTALTQRETAVIDYLYKGIDKDNTDEIIERTKQLSEFKGFNDLIAVSEYKELLEAVNIEKQSETKETV